jgi:hypothetical protein
MTISGYILYVNWDKSTASFIFIHSWSPENNTSSLYAVANNRLYEIFYGDEGLEYPIDCNKNLFTHF